MKWTQFIQKEISLRDKMVDFKSSSVKPFFLFRKWSMFYYFMSNILSLQNSKPSVFLM